MNFLKNRQNVMISLKRNGDFSSSLPHSVVKTGNTKEVMSIVGSVISELFQRLWISENWWCVILACPPPGVLWEKWYFRCPLEGAYCHSLKQCLSLLWGHVLTSLQKIGHYQRLLNRLCFHPHSAIHPNNQLNGKNLLQVLYYFTLRSQKSDGKNNTIFFTLAL